MKNYNKTSTLLRHKFFLVLFLSIIVGALSGCANLSFKANCNIDSKNKDKQELALLMEKCYNNPSIGVSKTF